MTDIKLPNVYRVWWDHKRYTVEDGQDVEAYSPEEAAEQFGWDRYEALQHVDPGTCFVRAPDGTTWRFSLSLQVDIEVVELKSKEVTCG